MQKDRQTSKKKKKTKQRRKKRRERCIKKEILEEGKERNAETQMKDRSTQRSVVIRCCYIDIYISDVAIAKGQTP